MHPEPMQPETDPHIAPPRHKDSSGKLVRVVMVAGILGVAAAGYVMFSDRIEQAKNTPFVQEEAYMPNQQFAENDQAPATPLAEPAGSTAAPASTPAPAPPPAPAVTESAPATPLPAPTTSTESPSGEPG